MPGPTAPDEAFLTRLPLAQGRPVLRYGVAVLAAVLATWLRWALGDALPPGFPYLTFFPAIILVAFLFGTGPGLVCAVLAGSAAWYLFIAPQFSFALTPAAALALGFFVFIAGVDITLIHLMQRANHRLAAERAHSTLLAEQRGLLFSELQHRVSNNIQVVAALLTLQKQRLVDPQSVAALEEASRRLAVIGRISRRLYDAEGVRLDVAAFFARVADEVLEAWGRPDVQVSVEVEPGIAIAPDAAVPVALVFTEALSNALEHGLAEVETGAIAATLRRLDDRTLELRVRDDGAGVPEGFNLDASPSLGLRIARLLAQQLGGEFTLGSAGNGHGGAEARLTFAAA